MQSIEIPDDGISDDCLHQAMDDLELSHARSSSSPVGDDLGGSDTGANITSSDMFHDGSSPTVSARAATGQAVNLSADIVYDSQMQSQRAEEPREEREVVPETQIMETQDAVGEDLDGGAAAEDSVNLGMNPNTEPPPSNGPGRAQASRELRNLSVFGWDAQVGEHPPGAALALPVEGRLRRRLPVNYTAADDVDDEMDDDDDQRDDDGELCRDYVYDDETSETGYSSNDSVEEIMVTQVQQEERMQLGEVQSTRRAVPPTSETHQASAAPAVQPRRTASLSTNTGTEDSMTVSELEREEAEIVAKEAALAALEADLAARRERLERRKAKKSRSAPRETEPNVRPQQRQRMMDDFIQMPAREDGRGVDGSRERAREPQGPRSAQRGISARPDTVHLAIPKDVDEMYDLWEQRAVHIIPDDASVYSNFRFAFGDDTEEGRRFRKKEIKAIGEVLFAFKNTRKPGQHALLKGREREGKTGALFSIALAALLLHMRVVILCAPNKLAPIVDMVKKIRASGFGTQYDTKHTLGKKSSKDNDVPSSDHGQIFVAALGTITDLRKVKAFIQSEIRGGHHTVTLIDECDELTQGKGNKSLEIERREDPSAYQNFIPLADRGEDEDDDDIPYVDPDSRAGKQKNRKEQLAAASHFFKKELHKITQVIACSATLSGYMLNPVGMFRQDVVTPIFMVYPKLGYRGIETFQVPDGCELEMEGNMSMDDFEDSSAVKTLLERFYNRKNICDGVQLQPRPEVQGASNERNPYYVEHPTPVTLRGMLFISCSPKVNVYGGVADIAKQVCKTVDAWDNEHDSAKTLFVCFVGVPKVYFAKKWFKMPRGASLETIYNITRKEAQRGTFGQDFALGPGEPLSKVCTHCVLIGYNLTRRAMTAAFKPEHEPGVLCKIQYGILTAPKMLTIDAVSQRVNRASHDFAEHDVPDEYVVDVAMSPVTLELCQKFRKMEDDMVDTQRLEPCIHSVFQQKIEVFACGLENSKVSKRGIRLAELSRTGQLKKERERRENLADQIPALREFRRWLENDATYTRGGRPENFTGSTPGNYYGHVKRLFVNVIDEFIDEGAGIDDIMQRFDDIREDIVQRAETREHELQLRGSERTPSEDDEYHALKQFKIYYNR